MVTFSGFILSILLHFYAFFRNSKVSCAIFLFAVNEWGENLIRFFPGVSITVSLKPASIYERKFAGVARIASMVQYFLAFEIFFSTLLQAVLKYSHPFWRGGRVV